MAYNLGCLPTPQEVMILCEEQNVNWSCHEQDGKLCAGYVATCLDNGIQFKGKEMIRTSLYLQQGIVRTI